MAIAADRRSRAREVVADARHRSERGNGEDESGQNERDAEDAQEVQHAEDECDDADDDLEWPERADDASAGFAGEAVIEEKQAGDDGDEGGQDGGLLCGLEPSYVCEDQRSSGGLPPNAKRVVTFLRNTSERATRKPRPCASSLRIRGRRLRLLAVSRLSDAIMTSIQRFGHFETDVWRIPLNQGR